MFSIDATSNDKYFIILQDGKEFCKVSKKVNTLEQVKAYFKITTVVKGGGKNETTSVKSVQSYS